MAKLDFHLDLGENYYDPYEFVEAVIHAESLGFSTAWFGDHFVPWFHSGKRSSFVWSVMSVALEKTERIKLGPLVTTPIGGRYHPALIAQASATIDNMYPGRFLLGVGTGEAINERLFWNDKWPVWRERIERLTEGVTLIRKLWEAPEPFIFKGKYFASDFLHLYTKPKTRIPIYFSAVGKKAAYYAGRYGDHLVTLSRGNGLARIRDEVVPAFNQGCEDAGKKVGQVVVSANITLEEPEEFWRRSRKELGYATKDSWSVKTPIQVEARGEAISLSELKEIVHFCKNWNEVTNVIEEYRKAGATGILLETGLDRQLMQQFAANVLTVF